MTTDIAIIIPARFASTRFPGKPLADVAGKPMIRRVWEQCRLSRLAGAVIVATDDARIADAVSAFGGEAAMTPPDLASGSERAAHVARGLPAAIIVNVQGDEPLIAPETIDAAIAPLLEDESIDIGTVCRPFSDPSGLENPNLVKVVRDARGRALYFSRAPIPFQRDRNPSAPIPLAAYRMHLGVYAFRRAALLRFAALPPSPLERMEALEQLRALENGMSIAVREVTADSIAVDTPADIARVLAALIARGGA